MKVLFSANMTAVNHQAHFEFQKMTWPTSHTSLTSGWRRQNSQTMRDVYKTNPATTTVKIKPGTRPRTEYDQGKDMMARQMYSEKRKKAVYPSQNNATNHELPRPIY